MSTVDTFLSETTVNTETVNTDTTGPRAGPETGTGDDKTNNATEDLIKRGNLYHFYHRNIGTILLTCKNTNGSVETDLPCSRWPALPVWTGVAAGGVHGSTGGGQDRRPLHTHPRPGHGCHEVRGLLLQPGAEGRLPPLLGLQLHVGDPVLEVCEGVVCFRAPGVSWGKVFARQREG